MTVLQGRLPSERGASAILIALSMVVLMGLAAIAIDGGIAFDERRQQQSGADVGALAAAQFADKNLSTSNATCASLTGSAYAACRGAEEAMDVVDGTLPGTYTAADWLACTDPGKPAKFSQGSALSPCINFTPNFQETRVVLPGVEVETTFGGIIGRNQIDVGAWAEVGLDLKQSADVLPWAVGPSAGGSSYSCLFSNSSSNLNVDPCNGPTSGNFGKLDLSLYGNYTMGTPQICGNSMSGTKMEVNLITGADHFLEKASAAPGNVHDFSNCPNIGTNVDEVRTQTGNSQNGIKAGLFEGTTATTDNYEGRLICKGNAGTPAGYAEYGNKDSYGNCVQVGNQFSDNVDDTPLWDFLESDPDETYDLALSVVDDTMCDSVTDHASMKRCLDGWRDYASNVGAHSEHLLKFEIRPAPRFAAVPLLNNDPSNGSGDYIITDFLPVYINTIYLKCNANTCDIAHSPGVTGPSNCPNPITAQTCGLNKGGNKSVEAITSYMLTIDMLHPNIAKDFPGVLGTKVYNLKR